MLFASAPVSLTTSPHQRDCKYCRLARLSFRWSGKMSWVARTALVYIHPGPGMNNPPSPSSLINDLYAHLTALSKED